MERSKKDGSVVTSIHRKKGHLYIVFSQAIVKDGDKTIKQKWISTRLTDTLENEKNAINMRARLLENEYIRR